MYNIINIFKLSIIVFEIFILFIIRIWIYCVVFKSVNWGVIFNLNKEFNLLIVLGEKNFC